MNSLLRFTLYPLITYGLFTTAGNSREIEPLGPGSYRLTRPDPCKSLPKEIYRTTELTGPTPTNQWWSSIVWQKGSHPLFAHPLTMQCHLEGLAVSYPGQHISGKSGHIEGAPFPAKGDLLLGLVENKGFLDARLAHHSDWFVTVEFSGNTGKLRTSFGHGSPYIFCKHPKKALQITSSHKPVIWSQENDSPSLGITVDGRHYGLFGAKGSKWRLKDETTFINQGDAAYSSIALLPDKEKSTLALFARHAHNHISRTRVISTVEKGQVKNRYQFELKNLEGESKKTLFNLYPHQWKYSKAPLLGKRYYSVRGTLELASGDHFETILPIQGLLPHLPSEGITDRQRLKNSLTKEITKEKLVYKDSYWEGKHLGKVATLSGIAEALGEKTLRGAFVAELKTRLENWFTASPGEQAPLFYYNQNWGTLIGSAPSYGSDSQLNDHHFHYGYFIRAAAEVARYDPAWGKKWTPMVELLIREIANSNRKDPLFPYLRCFDLYAGHSWASGQALYADGNNQESSSESLNAWYSLILWGAATGNEEILKTGQVLYQTERTAVEEYWFDVSQTNFPKDYPHPTLGMVWGGKGAFGTWFSGEKDHIYGINWLPFTPASLTLGRSPDYIARNHAALMQTREGGKDYEQGWGDLVVMFKALHTPAPMARYFDNNPTCKIEPGNSHAFMDHWLHTLDQLGLNSTRITADHPFATVFLKNGKKSYAIYHHHDSPLTVKFSDGKTVTTAGKGMTLAR